ncbi:thiolase family protein [Streptomyces sp. DSM 44917]|uniref:Thiolase family protein n=1 Tax=Streptomyces boetiae TaxID=3075541 RepID=A0ABU2L6Y3_9ACTN|nr:thiolase family protein [Streptomyces sp. DSM 44917]MDT0307324.1 thiolase family protein [Streptomyces sp. DSM 44917]
MPRVAVVAARRTPVAKGGRAYAAVHPVDLLAGVLADLVGSLAPVPAEDIGEVLVGCTHQGAEQAVNTGRNAWLAAGLPLTTPATTLDAQCGSSQQAANLAHALVASGQRDLVLAAGVESLTRVPMFSTWQDRNPYSPALLERFDMPHQGVAAERMARKYGVTRADADAWGYESHTRAARAWASGAFAAETSLVTGRGTALLDRDEGIRADTTPEALARLKPVYDPAGVTTAGNASQISDGASAVVLASATACDRYGLSPLAWIEDTVTVGVDPEIMLEGPIVATERLLERNGRRIEDIAHIELHEAFAVPVCAWLSVHRADPARVNPDGGAIGIGHPFGASGTRQLAHLAHALHASGPGTWGLQAMCAGGGIGTGTLLRSPD